MSRDANPDVILLHAAADATRLAILRELSSDMSVCACDFTECCTTVSQPTISHHLRVLREAGWVRAEHRGANVSYTLCADAVERFRQIASQMGQGASGKADEPAVVTRRNLEPASRCDCAGNHPATTSR
jgi:ArsR family transcriptional regulator